MTLRQMPGLFHTGMVVRDLEAAMRDFSLAFGLEWATPVRLPGEVFVVGGASFKDQYVTYSTQGPHHVELIEQIDNAAWATMTAGPLVHHIGFAVEDIDAEARRLDGLGFRREVWGAAADDPDRTVGMSYHHNPHGGLLVELVSTDITWRIDRWVQGGEPLSAPTSSPGAETSDEGVEAPRPTPCVHDLLGEEA